jgi:subtilisin family serine protease
MKIWVLSFMVIAANLFATPPKAAFQFREPGSGRYRMETEEPGKPWLPAIPEHSPTNQVQIGSRIVLQADESKRLSQLLSRRPLSIARRVNDTVLILQAPDALTAAREADQLGRLPGVTTSYPLMRREANLDGAFAGPGKDPYWDFEWYFENRLTNGWPKGADLNIRGAWPHARGNGVTIAIADTGFELDHRELAANASNAPHYNFELRIPDGNPPGIGPSQSHGTCVAGLAAADDNGIGMIGAAPNSKLASWVVLGTNQALQSRLFLVDDEALMDMFQFQSNSVQVQNHSWGHHGTYLDGVGLLPRIGISNAIQNGRDGRGVIMVRSGGNSRTTGCNANDSAFRSDPRVICVAATKYNGKVTSYSNPGACLLVAAVGPEFGEDMFTTDRAHTNGYNQAFRTFTDSNFWDYTFWFYSSPIVTGFGGTSASAPQISGLAALLLSANTNLTYRDVQQILIHSARHFDLLDPGLKLNGAGFLFSHNVGFGMPDAGHALRMAKSWPTRPSLVTVSMPQTNNASIPDGGLQVRVFGENVPANIVSMAAAPSQGVYADGGTTVLPLVDVGLATGTITMNLTNKAALVQHSASSSFADEITRVAQAGAAFAILFHTSDTNVPSVMPGTYLAPIPAVLIGQTRGMAIRGYVQTNTSATAQIAVESATYTFNVPQTLVCEHVGVRISFDHPTRADLRITLTSPDGTRSVLQQSNNDLNAAPSDWTYWSTQHFYESSAGTWTVTVTDEYPSGSGSLPSVELIVNGVAITDADTDGLDDSWETAQFSSLVNGPTGDTDLDGYSNAREQVLGTNPQQSDAPLQVDLGKWSSTVARASWSSSTNFNYEVWTGTNVASLALATNLPGKFPETEWFTPATNPQRFVRVMAVPR